MHQSYFTPPFIVRKPVNNCLEVHDANGKSICWVGQCGGRGEERTNQGEDPLCDEDYKAASLIAQSLNNHFLPEGTDR